MAKPQQLEKLAYAMREVDRALVIYEKPWFKDLKREIEVELGATGDARISLAIVPPYDEDGGSTVTATIAGRVEGLKDSVDCRVVVFARTDRWYIQPSPEAALTELVLGNWQTQTHLGREYAALLVSAAFSSPARMGRLPSDRNVLAIYQDGKALVRKDRCGRRDG